MSMDSKGEVKARFRSIAEETLAAKDTELDNILEQRGNRYGIFKHHAALTQELKRLFYSHMSQFNDESLSPSQREAIDMIMHKLGRIGNGDPNYADSWVDIAGYAQLVADELVGKTK